MLLMRQAIGIFVLCAKSVANETLPCRPLAPRSLPTCGLFLSFFFPLFSLYFSIFSHCPVLLANVQSKLRRVGLFNAKEPGYKAKVHKAAEHGEDLHCVVCSGWVVHALAPWSLRCVPFSLASILQVSRAFIIFPTVQLLITIAISTGMSYRARWHWYHAPIYIITLLPCSVPLHCGMRVRCHSNHIYIFYLLSTARYGEGPHYVHVLFPPSSCNHTISLSVLRP